MKICFLTNNYTFTGGLERVLSIVANELSKYYEINIISLYDLSKKCPYKYNNNVRIDIIMNKNKKNYFLDFNQSIKKVKNNVKHNKYDFLIYLGENLFPFAYQACKNTNTKCIYWMHNPAWFYNYPFIEKRLRKLAVKKSDFTITLTKESQDELIRKYNINNIINIANPVDDILVKKINYNNQSKKIISVGRISKQKNFLKLVEVAKLVFASCPEWSWDIYGTGNEKLKKEILDRIKNYELENHVFLKGVCNNIYDIYKEYSFQVMTSLYEGFPMVLIEGMSCGLPLISFDIKTGPKEIIENGVNGFLINNQDEKMMAEKIIYLINNLEARQKMSKYNEQLRLKYSTYEIGKKWKDFFDLLNNN